ncbi:hypothetical protein [Kineosporia sp. A_224]|uniref:hypothetical protein n=1 Tax=Kineosporia sp. A_224 TaxID=1962180 RepID=UPI00117A5D05|nr:hypothetical protein [Kineosporia sp. A_224]
MRLRRSGVVAGLVAGVSAVAIAVSATSASAAVGAFKARVLIGAKCLDGWTQTSSTGVTRGVMRCETTATGTELVLFTGNGTIYSKIRTGVKGIPVAFADDGTSYFALYEPESGRGAVMLLKRNHTTGVQTKITIRAATAATADDFLHSGALLVSGGKYWVAYTVNNGAILWGKTLTKQNLVPSLPATMPAVFGWQPSLARTGTGSVAMVIAQPPPFEAGIIVRYRTKADGTWIRYVVRSGGGGISPQISWSSGVTRISWLERTATGDYKVVYQDNATGSWVRTSVPGLPGGGWPRLRMFTSGGKLTFVYSGHAVGTRASEAQIVVTQRSGTTWSTTALSTSSYGNLLLGAGSAGGKTIVVFYPRYDPDLNRGVYSRRQA